MDSLLPNYVNMRKEAGNTTIAKMYLALYNEDLDDQEALVVGKWVWEEDGNKDVMTFMDNGKMQNTFINDDINGEAQLKYSVTGNTLTLVNNNDVEIPYAIYLFGDMLVMTGADFTRIYYRQASE